METISVKGAHYNLRWSNYSDSLLSALRRSEDLVDVTLFCEGRFIRAHKLILNANSEYFQKIFRFHREPNPVIVFNNIRFEELKAVVDFMYKGEIQVLDKHLEGVISLSKSLQVNGLNCVNISSKETFSKAENGQEVIKDIKKEFDVSDDSQATIKVEKPREENILSPDNDPLKDKKPRKVPLILKRKRLVIKKPEKINNETDSKRKKLKTSEETESESNEDSLLPTFLPITPLDDNSSNEKETGFNEISNILKKDVSVEKKSKRAPNAFMMFANEWRKKLTVENPQAEKKTISVMLGNMWKSLSNDSRKAYYDAAERAAREDKPGSTEGLIMKTIKLRNQNTDESNSFEILEDDKKDCEQENNKFK